MRAGFSKEALLGEMVGERRGRTQADPAAGKVAGPASPAPLAGGQVLPQALRWKRLLQPQGTPLLERVLGADPQKAGLRNVKGPGWWPLDS